MFSWRAKRQLAVLAIMSAVIGFFIFRLVSHLGPGPTCFDGVQNQGEVGADCGGPCEACELRNPKPLSIFWARAARASPGVLDGAALIENPNETLSSAAVNYQFTFFDEIGEIARRAGTTFVYPQERFYAVEPAIATVRVPTRIEFKITGVTWQIARFRAPVFIVERREYSVRKSDTGNQGVVEALVTNTASVGFRAMETSVVVFDLDGNLIGVNRVLNENVEAGSSVSVVSIWPTQLPGKSFAIDVRPRINLFASDAVLKP